MSNEKILVIGAGVNGCSIAVRLFTHGIDVKLLARGQRLKDLQQKGVIIEDAFSGKRTATHVPLADTLAPGDEYDYILVVVRKNQTGALLPTLARNCSPNIVFMCNNLLGPAEFTAVIDPRRVLLGTVISGGKRDGDTIYAITSTPMASPYGEIDGSVTPRLEQLIRVLKEGGIKAVISHDMVDFQMTHAVGVALIAKLTLKYRCDLHAMARATADLRLFVDARREAHRVMIAKGHKIVPASEADIRFIPRFIQVAAMKALLRSRIGEIGLGYHASQAPDELQCLVDELAAFVKDSPIPIPAITRLLAMD